MKSLTIFICISLLTLDINTKKPVGKNNQFELKPAEIKRIQQRSNEKYQRELKEYLIKFRAEQMAIADRFEETYDGLLEQIENENKTQFLEKIENLAETVMKENTEHQKTYAHFDKLKAKLRNEWMFPGI